MLTSASPDQRIIRWNKKAITVHFSLLRISIVLGDDFQTLLDTDYGRLYQEIRRKQSRMNGTFRLK